MQGARSTVVESFVGRAAVRKPILGKRTGPPHSSVEGVGFALSSRGLIVSGGIAGA